MNAMWKQQLFGALCLTLAAAIWGGVYVVSKVVLEEIPPFTLLIIRFAIASVVLGVFVVARREFIAKQDFPMIMAIAFVGVTISIGAQFLGTKLSTAHMGALITALPRPSSRCLPSGCSRSASTSCSSQASCWLRSAS